ncbi:hypothetical protein E2P81_ATG06437 [Venturia nashicola]|nr:hypothetical protein E2P81_ATG06437 [Venturia nashicola]
MDQSTSSLFSSGSPSPHTSRSGLLAELESNLSALGHVGMLKYSRDELRRQLQQQKSQTQQQSQAAATLRRIALRLTVNGQEKQDKISDLESTLQQFEDQGQRLLDTLYEDGNNHEFQSLHGPPRPLSPPTTPKDRKLSFGPLTPASSSRKSVSRSFTSASKRRDSHQLPTEVLQLCQQRVEGLLRQNRSNQQTIDKLRHSEISLHHIVERQEEELRSLDAARLTCENQLETARSKRSLAREDLGKLQKHIHQLEKDKASANGAIRSHEDRIQCLEAELGKAAHALDEAQSEKQDLQHTHNDALRELRDIQQTQNSLENAVRRHKSEVDSLNQNLSISRDEVFTSEQKLCTLQDELEQNQTMLSNLQQAIASHNEYQQEQKRDLENAQTSYSAIIDELDELKQKFIEATDLHQRTTQDLNNERQSAQKLQTIVVSLEKDLHQARARIHELESTQHELKVELSVTQSLKEGFSDSCTRLHQELDSEKARAAEVEAALQKDLAESGDKMINLQRFNGLLRDRLKETQNKSGERTADLQNQIACLNKDLVDEQERAAALERSFREEIAKSENKAAGLESSTLHLQEELAELQDSSAKMITHLQSQLATLHESLDAEKECGSAAERSLRESLGTAEDKAAELQTLTSQLRKELKKTRDASAKKVDEQQLELTKLEQDLKNEKDRAVELEVSGKDHKARANQKLTDSERSLAALKTELASATYTASENVLKLKSDISRLEQELETEKKQASNLQNTYDDHKEATERQIATLESTIAGLHGSLAEANSTADEKANALRADIAKLQQDLQTEKDQVSSLQSAHDSHKADAQSKIASIEDTVTELQGLLARTISESAETTSNLEAEVTKLEQEVVHEQDHTATLRASHMKQQAEAEAKIKSLESAGAELHDSLAKATFESHQCANSLRSRIATLETELQSQKDHTSQLKTSHENQLAESERHVTRTESIAEELRQTLAATRSNHQHHVESLEAQLNKTQDDMANAEQDHQRKYAQLLEAEQEAKRALSESVTSHTLTTTELKQERKIASSLEHDLTSHQNRIQILDGLLSRATDEAEASKTSVDKLHKVREALQKDLDDALENNQQVSNRLSDAETAHVALQEELHTTSIHRATLEHQLASTRALREQLEMDIASGRDESDLYRLSSGTKIQDLEDRLAALESQISETTAREQSAIEQSEAAAHNICELKLSLNSAQSIRQELEHAHRESHERIQFLEKAKSQLEDDLQVALGEFAQSMENNRVLQAELHDAETAISGLEVEKVELRDELADVQSKATRFEAASNTRFSRLQVERNYLAAELKSTRSTVSQLEAEKTQLLTGLHTTISTLESDKDRIAEELQDARSEVSRSAATKDGLVDQLNIRIADLENHIARIEGELQSSYTKVSQIEAENGAVALAHQTKIISLEHEILRIAEELKVAYSKVSGFEAENSHLARALETTIATFENDKAQILKNFRHTQAKVAHLENERDRLATELDVARLATTSLQNQTLSIQQESEAATARLGEENKDLSNRLKIIQAVRNSHNTALNALRVQLGTAKMAKRSVLAKLQTAEKDFAVLQRKNSKLEAELAKSEARSSHSEGASQAWQSKVVRLREEHADLNERVMRTGDTCSELRSAVTTLENRAADATKDFNQLHEALQISEATIINLRDEMRQLQQQHREGLQTVRQQDAHIASLGQQLGAKDATLSQNDETIAGQTSQINNLEDRAVTAEIRVQTLKSELQLKEAEMAQLREANDEYIFAMSPLHHEIRELRASKVALDDQHVEGNFKRALDRPRTAGEEVSYLYPDQCPDEENSYFRGSYFVGGELRPMSGPSRPMSGETRVGTIHSNRSSKAFRTLGLETLPDIEIRHTTPSVGLPRLCDLWEEEEGKTVQTTGIPNKSLPRRLTKKRREDLTGEKKERGKLYNLIHFGSLDKPHFLKRIGSRVDFYNLRR